MKNLNGEFKETSIIMEGDHSAIPKYKSFGDE